jgi:hypothetical protein
LVRADTSERDKARIHPSPRPKRYRGHKATECAVRVKVIDGCCHANWRPQVRGTNELGQIIPSLGE